MQPFYALMQPNCVNVFMGSNAVYTCLKIVSYGVASGAAANLAATPLPIF